MAWNSDSESELDYGYYCERCNAEIAGGDGNNEKDCDKCNKHVCIDCVKLTGCQTMSCVCIDCFKPKCLQCNKNIKYKLIKRNKSNDSKHIYIYDDMYCKECEDKFNE
jgi:hypothetical protein